MHPYVTRDGNLSVRCAREGEVVDPGPRTSRDEGPLARRLALRPVVLALRVLRAGAFAALGRRAPRRAPSPPGARPRVTFLIQHAYGMGGTIRTTLATAGHLAERCDVEVLSDAAPPRRALLRAPGRRDRDGRRGPAARPSPGPGRPAACAASAPSVLVHEDDFGYRTHSLWSDLQLCAGPARDRAGVLSPPARR